MRIHRLPILALGLLLTTPAFAAPPDSLASTSSAAPDKVYPPLPSLAMMPPGGGGEIEAPARSVGTAGGHRKVATLRVRKSAEPTPRMVVSDASHAYLASLERKLEQAMQK